MSETGAGLNASADVIEDMNYWQAKQKASDLRDYLQAGCSLQDRPSVLGSLAMLEKHVAHLSADPKVDPNVDIINHHASRGEYAEANAAIQASGLDLELEVTEESKTYHQNLNTQREERIPVLMKQLAIDEEAAGQFFDDHESPNRWQGSRPALAVKQKDKP